MAKVLLKDLLDTVDPAAEERVKKSLRRWKQRFGQFLSNRTRLKLNREGKRTSIRVSVSPGYPVTLGPLLDVNADIQAEHLSLVRRQIECCREDLGDMIPRFESLPGIPQEEMEMHMAALTCMKFCRNYLEDALRKVVINAIAYKILEIDADVLGLYRPSATNGEIVLFWSVIGLVAKCIGVSEEDLTAMVLAHEMAHAYTHRGLDADGRQWNGYASVTPPLAEALAQYYTHFALAQHRHLSPGIWDAYQLVVSRQSETYQHHLKWVDAWQPEVVRSALLEARRNKFRFLKEFEPVLEREDQRLAEFLS